MVKPCGEQEFVIAASVGLEDFSALAVVRSTLGACYLVLSYDSSRNQDVVVW